MCLIIVRLLLCVKKSKERDKAVMDCTRTVAPWPPEQTKTIIRVIEALAVTPTAEVAAPKP